MHKKIQFLLGISCLCIISGFLLLKSNAFPVPEVKNVLSFNVSQPLFPAYVVRVIDGDTLVVNQYGINEKVRLIGIDAPETVDKTKPIGCYGKEASEKMQQLLSNRHIFLQYDPTQSGKDVYGRLLRYVYLADQTMSEKILLQEGFVKEYTYANRSYRLQNTFRTLQQQAQKEKKGLWGKCI